MLFQQANSGKCKLVTCSECNLILWKVVRLNTKATRRSYAVILSALDACIIKPSSQKKRQNETNLFVCVCVILGNFSVD
jgi:hypothetical protein